MNRESFLGGAKCAAVGLLLIAGCEASTVESPSGRRVQGAPAGGAAPGAEVDQGPRQMEVVAPREVVTVEEGKVTIGRPQVTEEVERQIYKTLNYHRTVVREIEKRVPGGNSGSEHSRQSYELGVKSYMVQYGLSEADIEAILRKGDEQGWK